MLSLRVLRTKVSRLSSLYQQTSINTSVKRFRKPSICDICLYPADKKPVRCKCIVDKYIEYDPAIVMIDLVLVSKEAQRHVLYNTEFKSYWKLLIVLTMLETYGVWYNNSLFNIVANTLCGIKSNNSTPLINPSAERLPQLRIGNSTWLNFAVNISLPGSWNASCWAWTQEAKTEDNDLFIWEKDFYIQFISIFTGIAAFILTVQVLMRVMRSFSARNEVPLTRVLKAFSLANVSILFTLPMLVWGNADTSPDTRTVHYLLVFGYSFVVFLNVFTVLYECPVLITMFILIMSNFAKNITSFHTTPQLRRLIS